MKVIQILFIFSVISCILARKTKPISYEISTTPIVVGSNPGKACSSWKNCNSCAANQCEWIYSDESSDQGSCKGTKTTKSNYVVAFFKNAKVCRNNKQCSVSYCE